MLKSNSNDQLCALQMMREHPLGTLISYHQDNLHTSYIPLTARQLGQQTLLFGHLARSNPHQHLLEKAQVKVLFHGPNRYISPLAYADPLNVPTWNYMVVECSGRANRIDDKDGIEEILSSAVRHFEQENNTQWNYDLPPSFREQLVKEIIGLRIEVETIVPKFKLGQRRSSKDQAALANSLQNSNSTVDQQMLRWMTMVSR